MNNRAAIRAIYPQIDWDQYDAEVAEQERKATVRRAKAEMTRRYGWDPTRDDALDSLLDAEDA